VKDQGRGDVARMNLEDFKTIQEIVYGFTACAGGFFVGSDPLDGFVPV
jgi:hypothetical protein